MPRDSSPSVDGMTLRGAALAAGFAYLLNPVSYAEFSLYPRLVVSGHIDQTLQNIGAHPGVLLIAIACYLISFVGDIVIAWALYYLLAPVNRALSLLMAWLQLVYAAIALVGTTHLLTVHQLLTVPQYASAFTSGPLAAEVLMLLHAFRSDWAFALILFGAHLVLLGVLIYRSGYIPSLIGVILVLNGAGWIVNSIGSYAVPQVDWDFVSVTFLGEIVFMLWLLICGWKIRERAYSADRFLTCRI